jgi:hypothetical protein
VPDDRFGDLTGGRDRPSAAERLSELDAQPEPGGERPPSEPPRRAGSRYAWVVGVAATVAVVAAAINSLPNTGRGLQGPEPGKVLPDFAAPSADGESDADANIRQQDGGSEQEGAVAACRVEVPDVVNICDLRERPVVLTFVAEGCEDALDQVERLRSEYPRVSFVGVISGSSRDDLAELLGEHEWGFPVALDPDTAVFNLYRAADCPTTVTAAAGGEVVDTRNGPLSETELRTAVERVAGPAGRAA